MTVTPRVTNTTYALSTRARKSAELGGEGRHTSVVPSRSLALQN